MVKKKTNEESGSTLFVLLKYLQELDGKLTDINKKQNRLERRLDWAIESIKRNTEDDVSCLEKRIRKMLEDKDTVSEHKPDNERPREILSSICDSIGYWAKEIKGIRECLEKNTILIPNNMTYAQFKELICQGKDKFNKKQGE